MSFGLYSDSCIILTYLYLSVWVGGGRDLDASDGLFPVLGKMIFSPSDLSLSTKSSTSLPLPTSLSALLGPLDLKQKGIKLQPAAIFIQIKDCYSLLRV